MGSSDRASMFWRWSPIHPLRSCWKPPCCGTAWNKGCKCCRRWFFWEFWGDLTCRNPTGLRHGFGLKFEPREAMSFQVFEWNMKSSSMMKQWIWWSSWFSSAIHGTFQGLYALRKNGARAWLVLAQVAAGQKKGQSQLNCWGHSATCQVRDL